MLDSQCKSQDNLTVLFLSQSNLHFSTSPLISTWTTTSVMFVCVASIFLPFHFSMLFCSIKKVLHLWQFLSQKISLTYHWLVTKRAMKMYFISDVSMFNSAALWVSAPIVHVIAASELIAFLLLFPLTLHSIAQYQIYTWHNSFAWRL